MTISDESLVERVRGVWPGVEPGAPVRLTGGFWATMFRVPVAGQPDDVPDEVVVRLAPDRTMGAKEAEVQRAIAAQGFPTPAVHVSEPDVASDGWLSIMDLARGAPLLSGLDGLGVLRDATLLARTLPMQLAGAMAALHRLDPAPVTAAVRAVAPQVAWSAPEVVEQYGAGAAALGRSDIERALEHLTATMPDPAVEVVCHGDLHPFNVLDDDGELTVLDWTGAVVADPCFDVAFTELLLGDPPVALPGPLRAVVRRIGRLLARRFVAAYVEASPAAQLASLPWYRVLHSARVLLEVASQRSIHGPGAGGHPLVIVAPAAARNLSAATGVRVAP